jgi:excisionase family DNA binding protein
LRGRARALDPNGFENERAIDTDVLDEAEAMEAHDDETLLTPSEVAAMFRVNPKTVTRWARAGKISAIRTLGGHRRFRASEIRHFLEHVEEADRI